MTRTRLLPRARGAGVVTAYPLEEAEREEALAFLAERPLHTVVMVGLIRDNGVRSALNRGTFYACRDARGRLEGVALIGHATVLDARTRRAFREFARTARDARARTHMIMGEAEALEEFWGHYAGSGRLMRRACRELLFELRSPCESPDGFKGLKPATAGDVEIVATVHAGLAEAESGVNPLAVDAEGFRARCLRRILQGRVWVVFSEDGRLVFKADVQAETPEVVYLEGVYVHPAERGSGTGRACLNQLGRELLGRASAVCLFVNEQNERAHAFYRACGYELRGVYDTIFLQLD